MKGLYAFHYSFFIPERSKKMEENQSAPEIKINKNKFILWLENFWYHYKWHTIIVSIALIILVVCLWQTSTTEKHDTVIVYAGPTCLSTNETRQLQEVLSGILPSDYDGNGEKNASMSMYEIYSEKQIKEYEKQKDHAGNSFVVDRARNTTQYEQYSNYFMIGESPVCLIDPWLHNSVPEEYFYPLSQIFGENMPKGAIYNEDGECYGVRLGDTDLYKDFGIVRLLPADTVICLSSPRGGLGQEFDDKKYQFELETFVALVTYTSSAPDASVEDTGATVESVSDTRKREDEAA